MEYYPGQVPQGWDRQWLQAELRRIAEVLSAGSDAVRIEATAVAPTKVVEGMIRRADGTNWDPGRGAGLYIYRGGSWKLIEAGFTAEMPSMQFFLGEG